MGVALSFLVLFPGRGLKTGSLISPNSPLPLMVEAEMLASWWSELLSCGRCLGLHPSMAWLPRLPVL